MLFEGTLLEAQTEDCLLPQVLFLLQAQTLTLSAVAAAWYPYAPTSHFSGRHRLLSNLQACVLRRLAVWPMFLVHCIAVQLPLEPVKG